jgi:hypothetical protein
MAGLLKSFKSHVQLVRIQGDEDRPGAVGWWGDCFVNGPWRGIPPVTLCHWAVLPDR